MSIATAWGTRAEERRTTYSCDAWPEGPADEYFRGVTANAPHARCFRWLCQLRVAPYSYDWIDNLGRTSPQTLTPGLEELALGQTFMTFFELRSFTPDRELTLASRTGSRGEALFGRLGLTYRVVPIESGGSRILAKLRVQYPAGLRGRLLAALLPWGDLVMMRRQLLNLKRLAERVPAPSGSEGGIVES